MDELELRLGLYIKNIREIEPGEYRDNIYSLYVSNMEIYLESIKDRKEVKPHYNKLKEMIREFLQYK